MDCTAGRVSTGGKLRYLLPTLADIAQVVVPDQRGHGLSSHGSAEQWNLARWAADVKALADALGIERPIVLGESFGGLVAQQYASSYPEHPGAIVIVSVGPRLVRRDEVAARTDLEGATEVAAALRRPTREDPGGEAWRTQVEPLLRRRQNDAIDRVNAMRIRAMDVNEHFEAELFGVDLRPGLANVRCPVLVVVGEHDILAPPHLARQLVDALPSGLGRLEVVPDASHEVLTDNPGAAWPVIREFIGQLH